MAHTDRTYRTHRPHRVVTWIDHNADGTVDTIAITQEFGRRAGEHTHKSAVRDRQRAANRGDRRTARAQLRRDADSVELRQPRGRALWSSR